MIVKPGEKVHVIARRRFDGELRRHFVGEIKEVFETSARIQGHVFIFSSVDSKFVKKPELRTTIVDLAESGYIVNIIPPEVVIDQLRYLLSDERKLVVTDNQDFSLDINEFGADR